MPECCRFCDAVVVVGDEMNVRRDRGKTGVQVQGEGGGPMLEASE